ncbi:Hypothetical protein ETEE_2603 [Edwardsiella anguillarum ET080813]|uniref:Uncharacterized protein n=1 Tax=Edwardsiella anguillarum ET080813 TaxID=667120 RepID=A0A076LKT4_9GAMM|nr:Hypothetical protein ETEE_2603 [Edwardsiella anguillarum ET080813]
MFFGIFVGEVGISRLGLFIIKHYFYSILFLCYVQPPIYTQ